MYIKKVTVLNFVFGYLFASDYTYHEVTLGWTIVKATKHF